MESIYRALSHPLRGSHDSAKWCQRSEVNRAEGGGGAILVSIAMYFFAVVNWHKSVNDAAIRVEEHVKTLESNQREFERQLKTLEEKLDQIPATATQQPGSPSPGSH